MSGPTYSVVVAARNAASTLERAIRSAQAQGRPPDEIVVCDNGSIDGTGAVARQLGVTVVEVPTPGLSRARNAAIKAARGDYVVLLDADDEWLPTRLSAIDEKVQSSSCDVVTTDAEVRWSDGRTARWYELVPYPSEDQRISILRYNFVFVGAAVRRSRLEDVGYFSEHTQYQSEYDGWLKLILSGSRVAFVEQPLAVYYRSTHSLGARALYDERHDLHALAIAARLPLSAQERAVLRSRVRALRAYVARAEAVAALNRRRDLAAMRSVGRVLVTRGVPRKDRLQLTLRALGWNGPS